MFCGFYYGGCACFSGHRINHSSLKFKLITAQFPGFNILSKRLVIYEKQPGLSTDFYKETWEGPEAVQPLNLFDSIQFSLVKLFN